MHARSLTALFAIGLAAASVVVPATSAGAAPAIRISRVQYDSPGPDRGSNASLNAEWVQIANTSKKTQALTGWRLRDENGFVYVFPATRLAPGKFLKVHTGKGGDSAAHRYWQRGRYVWNNTGDTATLKNKAGRTIDSCSFDGGGQAVSC